MKSQPFLPLAILMLTGFFAAAVFHQWPQIDLSTSALFYRPDGGFYLEFDPWLRGIYLFVTRATRVALVIMLAVFILQLISRMADWRFGQEKLFRRMTPYALLYLLMVLAIGPGAGIHYAIKEGFERPRPREVTEFGGKRTYLPAFTVGVEEGKSFVSGHAAMGFYLAAFAMLARGRWRIILYSLAVVTGCGIGAVRVMQGGHFVSDIVFSGIFTLLVVHGCYGIFRSRLLHLQQ